MIIVKLNVSKINKERLFQGKNGKYLDIALFDKPDSFGNAGFVKEDVSKEDRSKGVQGNIIGNWKIVGGSPKPPTPTADDQSDEECPF